MWIDIWYFQNIDRPIGYIILDTGAKTYRAKATFRGEETEIETGVVGPQPIRAWEVRLLLQCLKAGRGLVASVAMVAVCNRLVCL